MDAAQRIFLYNEDKEPFEGRWDGKDYTIEDEPIEIQFGIAQHWIGKGANLRVEEIPPEEIEKRKPANPLEENSRGKAFASLKKKKGDA